MSYKFYLFYLFCFILFLGYIKIIYTHVNPMVALYEVDFQDGQYTGLLLWSFSPVEELLLQVFSRPSSIITVLAVR